jgi:ABC-type antimicrobial peptide transport system permease subunit
MALGAQLGNILRLIVLQGMKPVMIGVVIGLILAIALGKVVASMVYGVSTTDVITMVSGSALLVVVAILASFVPAYRATRVQPVEVLRQE